VRADGTIYGHRHYARTACLSRPLPPADCEEAALPLWRGLFVIWGVVRAMNKPNLQKPFCHGCKVQMVSDSRVKVADKYVLMFRCPNCNTLEAVEVGKAA